MKHLEQDTRRTFCQASTTYSSTIGSLVAVIRDYYKNIFPKNYIKSYYINTRDFSEEMQDTDVFRKEKPILSIKPNISFDSEDNVMGLLPRWHYSSDFLIRPMKHHYLKVLIDEDKEAFIYASHERFKVTFDINILYSTRMQSINGANYFKTISRQRSYFYLEDIWLETTLPKTMVYGLAEYFSLDLEKDEDIAVLNNYLNTYSNYQITRKKSLSSNIENYYFKFKTRLLVRYPNYPEVDSGQSNGQIESDFSVSSTMEVEFNAPNMFILELGKIIYYQELEEKDFEAMENQEMFLVSLPKSIVPSVVKEEVQKLVVWQGYVAESDVLDVLNITDVLNEEMIKIIDRNNEIDKKLNDEIFEIVLFKDEDQLDSSIFRMDWENKDLINKQPEQDATYYFGIYVNTVRANEILLEVYGNNEYIKNLEEVVRE